MIPRVELTNPGKVLYPATGTTKADVLRYYTGVAGVMLPHIAGRPATRKRWPDGVDGPAFFEKRLPKSAPAWLHRGTLAHRSGEAVYPIIDSPAGLAWIAQQAALEIHVPQWRFGADGTPGPANRLVFDLDPGPGVSMAELGEVAHRVRRIMDGMGMVVLPLTTGSKGMHLYVPLAEPVPSAAAAVLARQVAQQLVTAMPTLVTATMARELRAGKVFVDWSQNTAAKTTVAPYSLRGQHSPTVAAPRTWAEIGDPDLRQLHFEEVLVRVCEHGDLLAGLDDPPGPLANGDPPARQVPGPMLATPGPVDRLPVGQWAFEGKYDGCRMLVDAHHGTLRLLSRTGQDVTAEYPQLHSLAATLAGHDVLLDGEAVALDPHGIPDFAELSGGAGAERIQFWAFDILRLDGRSLLRVRYRDRRQLLETLGEATGLIVPALLAGDGRQALASSRQRRWEGVVAKKWDSTYQPGRRSPAWIKDKNWNTQEVVIGGWRPGEGGRSGGIGALLLGVPDGGGLRYVGRVGTGFTEKALVSLKSRLAQMQTDVSPFSPALPASEAKEVCFVRPELVGEVRYREITPDGRLRHPSWRGLRLDKRPADVKRECLPPTGG